MHLHHNALLPTSANLSSLSILDDDTPYPSIHAHLNRLRSCLSTEEKSSACTDPITLQIISSPVYCVGRLWEKETISRLISDAASAGHYFFKHPLTRELIDVDITLVEDPAAAEFIASIVEIESRDDSTSTSNITTLNSNVAAVSSTNQALRKMPTNLYDNDTGCQILVHLLQTADAVGFDNTLGVGSRKKWIKQCKRNWFEHGFLSEYVFCFYLLIILLFFSLLINFFGLHFITDFKRFLKGYYYKKFLMQKSL